MNFDGGDYILSAYAEGENPNACSIRIIGSVPSDADSFGGTFVTLQNGNTVTLTDGFEGEEKQFNYIWFWINPGTQLNFILDVNLFDDSHGTGLSEGFANNGNIYSKPIITIHGYGTIGVYLDNEQYFSIDLGNKEFITIDTEQMQAYKGGTLMNRFVTGNYDNFQVKVGYNLPRITGEVIGFEIDRYSRWI